MRYDKGWSQAQLAKKIGASPSVVAHYETGERFPSLENLIRLSRVFGVTTDFLLGIDKTARRYLDVENLSSEQFDLIQRVIENFYTPD